MQLHGGAHDRDSSDDGHEEDFSDGMVDEIQNPNPNNLRHAFSQLSINNGEQYLRQNIAEILCDMSDGSGNA